MRVIKREDSKMILDHLRKRFFPMQAPISLSLSDMILSARDFLLGKNEHVCGDVFGFLSKPYEIDKAITVSRDDIIASCNQIKDGEFLPDKIKVGEEFIGPADWIYAAYEVILGASCVEIEQKKQLPCLNCMPEVRDSNFKGTWQHSDSFEDKYLSDRLRYQSWTMRFRTKSPTVEP